MRMNEKRQKTTQMTKAVYIILVGAALVLTFVMGGEYQKLRSIRLSSESIADNSETKSTTQLGFTSINTDLTPLQSIPGMSDDAIAHTLMAQLYNSTDFTDATGTEKGPALFWRPTVAEIVDDGMYLADCLNYPERCSAYQAKAGYFKASFAFMEKFLHEGYPYVFIFGQSATNGGCHICGAETRLGIFTLKDGAWKMIYQDRIQSGVWGTGPAIKTFAIGDKKYGFLFEQGNMNQGQTYNGKTLYHFNGKEFIAILRINAYGSDGLYERESCSNKLVNSAWEESREIKRGKEWQNDQAFNDLIVSRTGTTLNIGKNKVCTIVPETGSTMYTWDGFVYREYHQASEKVR